MTWFAFADKVQVGKSNLNANAIPQSAQLFLIKHNSDIKLAAFRNYFEQIRVEGMNWSSHLDILSYGVIDRKGHQVAALLALDLRF